MSICLKGGLGVYPRKVSWLGLGNLEIFILNFDVGIFIQK